MKNIVTVKDIGYHIAVDTDCRIASADFNQLTSEFLILLTNGKLFFKEEDDDSYVFKKSLNIIIDGCIINDWFYITQMIETGDIVCISHSGEIIRISGSERDYESEGCVDGGVVAAQWSPDRTTLVLVTNNDSMISMTNNFEVLSEVPIEGRVKHTTVSISWRGDGKFFAITSTDILDNVARVRVYTQELELHSTGRNIVDGAGSVIRGLGNALAYAANGSLVAVPYIRDIMKPKITFLEQNGLRHGEFDLQVPSLPSQDWCSWVVTGLHWDIATGVLAVSLQCQQNKDADILFPWFQIPGIVQLYVRGNYHWYLKSQYSGYGLHSIGFDHETEKRLYLAQSSWAPETSYESTVPGSPSPSSSFTQSSPACELAPPVMIFRVVELAWGAVVSDTADCSVAVVDGAKLLLTPLGLSLVPPPMSAHTQILPAPCVALYFWRRPKIEPVATVVAALNSTERWGLLCLCNSATDVKSSPIISLIYADSSGQPELSQIIDWAEIASHASGNQKFGQNQRCFFRSVACVECSESSVLSVLLVGSVIGTGRMAVGEDIFYVVQVSVRDGSVLSSSILRHGLHPAGAVVSLAPWGRSVSSLSDLGSIAVGLTTSSGFQIEQLALHRSVGDGGDDAVMIDDILTSYLPEKCIHIAIIRDEKDSPSNNNPSFVAVGLSERNRLYCGEVLIMAGVSSFAINRPLEILTYITVGTRPQLHFVSLKALLGLTHLPGLQSEGVGGLSGNHYTVECAESRPVERGARIVACCPGSARVVIQLPRGNIEAFEPRPFVLIRARELIEKRRILSCLSLLRRQRVDLNFIVDYDPQIFLESAESFVLEALDSGSDLLSLFIASLEPSRVSIEKYPDVDLSRTVKAAPADMTGYNKIGTVCNIIMKLLMEKMLNELPRVSEAVLNPILCTLTKQCPPLLEDALELISRVAGAAGGFEDHAELLCIPRLWPAPAAVTLVTEARIACIADDKANAMRVSSKSRRSLLCGAKAQAAIKYLVFLVDGAKLFDAALGRCDFEMARAIARQCQMDPKKYVPLIEKLQGSILAAGSASSHSDRILSFATTNFAISMHLNRALSAVHWGIEVVWIHTINTAKAVTATNAQREKSICTTSTTTIDEFIETLFDTICQNSLFYDAFPLLQRIANLSAVVLLGSHNDDFFAADEPMELHVPVHAKTLCSTLLRRLYLAHGNACIVATEYNEAVASFLTASPPFTAEAIRAARLAGDWSLALDLAGRFSLLADRHRDTVIAAAATLSVPPASLSPVSIAREIVAGFRESQEQGETGDIFDPSAEDILENNPDGGVGGADRAVEAANICLDFCDDVESAVAILCSAGHWVAAARAAIRKNRRDLLTEEISPAVRTAAFQLIESVQSKYRKQVDIVTHLKALWADPAARLVLVAEGEADLRDELAGMRQEQAVTYEDDKSEFSLASYRSGASNLSLASALSSSSSRSGMSSVSVLSSLSLSTAAASQTDSKRSNFSVEGLDHTLLSRGDGRSGAGGAGKLMGKKKEKEKKKESEKRQRKREKKMYSRGRGPDVYGLKREAVLCEELWSLAQFKAVAMEAKNVCDALLLIGATGSCVERGGGAEDKTPVPVQVILSDTTLAAEVQTAVDIYAEKLQECSAPVAPQYPPGWCRRRHMVAVLRFQDQEDTALSSNVHPSDFSQRQQSMLRLKTWWQVAADGIILWRKLRRKTICFHY